MIRHRSLDCSDRMCGADDCRNCYPWRKDEDVPPDERTITREDRYFVEPAAPKSDADDLVDDQALHDALEAAAVVIGLFVSFLLIVYVGWHVLRWWNSL